MAVGSRGLERAIKNIKRKRLNHQDNIKSPFLVGIKERKEKNFGGEEIIYVIAGSEKGVMNKIRPGLKKSYIKEDIGKGYIKRIKGFGGREEIETGEVRVEIFRTHDGKAIAELKFLGPYEGLTLGMDVPPGLERQGVGATILHQVIKDLKKEGVEKVIIHSGKNAKKFYKSQGLKLDREVRDGTAWFVKDLKKENKK